MCTVKITAVKCMDHKFTICTTKSHYVSILTYYSNFKSLRRNVRCLINDHCSRHSKLMPKKITNIQDSINSFYDD